MIGVEELKVNGEFYTFLKESITNDILNNRNRDKIFNILSENKTLAFGGVLELIKSYISDSRINKNKKYDFNETLELIKTENDFISYRLSFYLIYYRHIFLLMGKSISISSIANNSHSLTKMFDSVGRREVYFQRANTALVCKKFFENLKYNISTTEFVKDDFDVMSNDYQRVISLGVDPNQIFMIQLIESLRQSSTSNSGNNYEMRIKDILIKDGILNDDIVKRHDSNDQSLEYDWFFSYKGRKYGIGAKRTLRERYKQFSEKEEADADVFITITLGDDLNESKLEEITKGSMCVFVADEVYDSNEYMQNNSQVYKGSDFTLSTLEAFE